MIGVIVGDLVSSRFKNGIPNSKEFQLMTNECKLTDKSLISLATCLALLKSRSDFSDLPEKMLEYTRFIKDIYDNKLLLFTSIGCAWVGESIEQVKYLSNTVIKVFSTDRHLLRNSEVLAVVIFLARTGSSIFDILLYITSRYREANLYYNDGMFDFVFEPVDEFIMTMFCAFEAFCFSLGFEDAIRESRLLKRVSDRDSHLGVKYEYFVASDKQIETTLVAAIAEAYYGVPSTIREKAYGFMDNTLLDILKDFESLYKPQVEQPKCTIESIVINGGKTEIKFPNYETKQRIDLSEIYNPSNDSCGFYSLKGSCFYTIKIGARSNEEFRHCDKTPEELDKQKRGLKAYRKRHPLHKYIKMTDSTVRNDFESLSNFKYMLVQKINKVTDKIELRELDKYTKPSDLTKGIVHLFGSSAIAIVVNIKELNTDDYFVINGERKSIKQFIAEYSIMYNINTLYLEPNDLAYNVRLYLSNSYFVILSKYLDDKVNLGEVASAPRLLWGILGLTDELKQ